MHYLPLIAAVLLFLPGAASGADTSPAFPADGANYNLFPADKPPLVPKPRQVTWGGHAISVESAGIVSPAPSRTAYPEQMTFIRDELTSFLKEHRVQVGQDGSFAIQFVRGGVKTETDNQKLQDEAYSLKVTPKGAVITAKGTRGFFYGMKTLEQLLLRRNGKTTVAECSIVDWPDLEVRGFMNDVGRNYMPLPLIAQELDSLAQLKFNVYHFHFTEYPGWRLESKLYPELNDPRYFTRMPGKFYTQKEFKQLVEYCRLRNILLIPEMDMPGHSECFRRALKVRMSDEKATKALEGLIREMCSLVPKEKMPVIHIGTDEANGKDEQVNDETLKRYFNAVESCGRTPMRWQPGLSPKGYKGAIQHLWTGRQNRRAWPTDGAKYIDSLETYLNHMDPFETAMTLYFRRPCPFRNADGLGMILCSWPDMEIADPRNQVLQTPVYPGIGFAAESMWNHPLGKKTGDPDQDEYMKYFSNLPVQSDELLKGFADYENRVLAIRDRFFGNKEFNYVRQANIPWKLLGPIPNDGKTAQEFGPEQDARAGTVRDFYNINGKNYAWSEDDYTGATLIFKHYCDFPTLFNDGKMGAFAHKNHTRYAMTHIHSPKKQTVPFWVSGHTWATSDWRNGPVSVPGKWFHADPMFFVNGRKIEPPRWAKPGNNGVMADENYHFRAPTMISLNKGWNRVLVKSPNNASTRRWMFTFVPVLIDAETPGSNVKEFPGLRFSTKPE